MSRKPDPSTNAPSGPEEKDRLARRLTQIVDVGLAGCIFVVPMLMGGRHPLGRLALVVLAVGVALAWALRQSLRAQGFWRRSPAQWLLLAGAALLAVQLVPLPAPLLERLAPHTSEILPLWRPGADVSAKLGVWSQVSLTPAATRGALVMFLAYGLVFLVIVQRIRAVEDVERLLRWCALSALLMATFGLVQLVTANGKFFWVYEDVYGHTYRTAKGAFANRNHFAHFLALGVGPLIWWAQDGLRRRRRGQSRKSGPWVSQSQRSDLGSGLRVAGLGIVLFAVLLSLSRGGALATLLAVSICLAVCYRASSMGPKLVLGFGAAALLIGMGLAIYGHDRVSDRLESLTAGSVDELDRGQGRRTIWGAVAKAIPDYALLGSGVGSHREIYPIYLEWVNSRRYYSHAENGYLQVALESGIAGLGLLVAGIGLCGFWCVSGLRYANSKRLLVCVGAVAAGLAASAAHSWVDFVWYVPGCVVIIAVLAACACRLWQIATSEGASARRRVAFPGHVALIGVAVLAVLGAWMLKDRVQPAMAASHWERFLMLDRDSEDPLPFAIVEPATSTTDEEYRSSLAAKQRVIAELKEVVRWEPQHARAHLRLAEAYIRLFHQKQETSANVMSVNQVRDAVLDSRSETVPPERRLDSREKLEQWLSVAIGEHYKHLDLALLHTRRALAACPLLGEGYLWLGELCFLEGGRESAKAAYVAQALKVRPFDGTVLLHAGSEAILNGDFDQGLSYWRNAFQRGPIYQAQIIDWLVGRVNPWDLQQEIRFFLETFQPDLEGLRLLERRYRKIARPEQMVSLRETHVAAVEAKATASAGQEGAALWLEAMGLYEKLNVPERRLQCGRNALRCDPNDPAVREKLADCLADVGQFAEAEQHLKWALARKPDHAPLAEKLREVTRKQSDREKRTARSRGAGEYLR